jgi:hypothetical protein
MNLNERFFKLHHASGKTFWLSRAVKVDAILATDGGCMIYFAGDYAEVKETPEEVYEVMEKH